LFTVARDQTLRSWNTQQSYGGKLRIRSKQDGTYSATFTPDGSQIYVATYAGRVLAFDSSSGEKRSDFVAHADSSCNFLAIDGAGKRLLTCSWDKTAKLWRFQITSYFTR
jgi:WD40 repeat protein